MMTLDEAIKHCEEVAEKKEASYKVELALGLGTNADCKDCAEEHQQLAEWLRELKEQRKIQDILLQFLVDGESDICCDELAESEEEWEICGENCNNHTKNCWIRWAKMKAREVNADGKRRNK